MSIAGSKPAAMLSLAAPATGVILLDNGLLFGRESIFYFKLFRLTFMEEVRFWAGLG